MLLGAADDSVDMAIDVSPRTNSGVHGASLARAARHDLPVTRACQAALLESALDSIVSMDANGVVLEWNPAAERTFGYARCEAVGRELAGLIVAPASREAHRAALRLHLAMGWGSVLGRRLELNAVRADAYEIPVDLTITRSDVDGRTIFTGVLRDLTGPRRAEAALQASEERFRTLVEQLPCVTYECEFDANSTIRYISPQIEAWTGLSRESWTGDPRVWQRIIHPDDHDRVVAEFARCHTAEEPFESEYRLIADDGRELCILDREQLVYDSDGEPTYTQGIMVDMSAQRRAEQRTREIVATAHDAFVSIDTQGRIAGWNVAAERLLGWTADQAIGRDVTMTVPARLRAEHRDGLDRATAGPFSVETVRLHRDGHEIPVEIAVAALREGDGWVFNGFLRDISERLEAQENLQAAQHEALQRLAIAAEYRDDETGQHTRRVGDLSARLAAELGLAAEEVELLRRAAPLHDVGKIGIPDTILLKPGRLTPDEFDQVKTHTVIGAKMLAGGGFPLLETAECIARSHHERWDGTGYPAGLAGGDIPLAGRIVAIADVFDALTHNRPYKSAWSKEEGLAEIEAQRGRQFDPELVDAFRMLFPASRMTAGDGASVTGVQE
jgi:PAS domain S-box-containing protein/putative nucleotidyltransferase with HDIG domain